MKIVNAVHKLCVCCMEEHNVHIVEVNESTIFKGQEVNFKAIYEYCDVADEYLENEDMITVNDIAMKDSYRKQNNLLTSEQIVNIRKKYSITQKDLACLLGWGEKTITRYEGHQVQDMAHDSVLKKIDNDPEWFLELLENGKYRITKEAYNIYKGKAMEQYELMRDSYLRKFLLAKYNEYRECPECNWNKVSIERIIDDICYFAESTKDTSFNKAKLQQKLEKIVKIG